MRLGSSAHHDRDVGANLWNKPPVVAMSVGKDDCEQRRIMFPEARNLRNECRVRFNRIERQAEINNNAASRRLDLNAGAADLLGAAMDADPHAISPLEEPSCSIKVLTDMQTRFHSALLLLLRRPNASHATIMRIGQHE